jgi:ketosteroid isomerase-like protein
MTKLIFSTLAIVMIAVAAPRPLAQMRKPGGDNIEKAKAFFAALEKRDITGIPEMINENASLIFPFVPSGKTDPEAMRSYKGKQEVMRYLNGVPVNFKQIRFYDLEFTESRDGNTIFAEAKSDCVGAKNDAPYRNIYIFRFDFANGKVTRVLEYANPVPAAIFFGVPLGK